jgi:hypothetical protein
MKNTWKLVCLAACVSTTLTYAQTRIDLRTQGKNIDFSDATSTRPFRVGTTLPPTCRTGEMFFLSTAPAGNNAYGCIATNVWVSESGTSGSAGSVSSVSGKSGVVTLESTDLSDCRTIRSTAQVLIVSACSFGFPGSPRRLLPAATVTLLGGAGVLYIYARPSGTLEVLRNGTLTVNCEGCVDGGIASDFPADVARIGRWTATAGQWDSVANGDERAFLSGPVQLLPDEGIRVTSGIHGQRKVAIDTAVVHTRSAFQAAQETLCTGAGTASAQTCSLLPALTAYTTGMVIRFQPSATNTGALTLNINNLGPKAVKGANGVDDPGAGDIAAGHYYQLVYDGSAFRAPRLAAGKVRMTQYMSVMSSLPASGTTLDSRFTSRGPALSGTTVNAPASSPVYSWSSASIPDSSAASLNFHVALHPRWRTADGIAMRVYYYVASTPSSVVLKGEVSCTGTGDPVTAPFNVVAAAATVNTTPVGNSLQSLATLSFSGSALASSCSPGKIAHIRLWRDGADAFTGNVEITGLETEYWAGVE